jgi:hypothetical protein
MRLRRNLVASQEKEKTEKKKKAAAEEDLVAELPRRGKLTHAIFVIREEEEPILEYLHADIVHFVLEFSRTVHLD